jgi:hypothetical protein
MGLLTQLFGALFVPTYTVVPIPSPGLEKLAVAIGGVAARAEDKLDILPGGPICGDYFDRAVKLLALSHY